MVLILPPPPKNPSFEKWRSHSSQGTFNFAAFIIFICRFSSDDRINYGGTGSINEGRIASWFLYGYIFYFWIESI